MTKDEKRQSIYKNGWRQGSIISLKTLKEHIERNNIDSAISLPDPNKVKKTDSAYVVVINMSCDVVFGKEDQLPQIKCLLCWPKSNTLSNSALPDPRQFVLNHCGKTLSFRMKDRLFVHIDSFCHVKPDYQLSDEEVNALVRWKVAQFNRLGLPEALASRIGDALQSEKFMGWINKTSSKLEGIFLEIKPMAELPENIPYKVGVIAVADSSKTNQTDIFDIAQEIEMTLLEPLREKDGIELLNDSKQYEEEGIEPALSSSEFSYDMLKRFRRFYLDHYSLDPDSNSAPIAV